MEHACNAPNACPRQVLEYTMQAPFLAPLQRLKLEWKLLIKSSTKYMLSKGRTIYLKIN